MPRLIDLSHTVREGMITYPGLPGPRISDFMSRAASRERYAEGTEFHIARIEMVANTGTYLDAPFHRFADGPDVSDLDLEATANLEGITIRPREWNGRAIEPSVFDGARLVGRAVLIQTGWSRHWGTEAYEFGHPYLSRESAELLVASGAALVGIDSLNIDDTAGGERPAHTLLLQAGIPVVEHLTGLENLPEGRFRFFAVPAKFAGVGSFPVRAFALCPG